MKFIRIRVRWEDRPKDLYRVLLVREDIDLKTLDHVLRSLFKMNNGHESCFLGDRLEQVYTDPSLFSDFPTASVQSDYSQVRLLDALKANANLRFLYDLDNEYRFLINRSSAKTISLPLLTDAILLEAKGDGIFEEDREGLHAFLKGGRKAYFACHADGYLPIFYSFFPEFDLDYINLKFAIEENPVFDSWKRPKERLRPKKYKKKKKIGEKN